MKVRKKIKKIVKKKPRDWYEFSRLNFRNSSISWFKTGGILIKRQPTKKRGHIHFIQSQRSVQNTKNLFNCKMYYVTSYKP